MRFQLTRCAALALILAPASGILRSAHAGPLEQTSVDQGATWVVHIDIEAALRSVLGKFLIEKSSPDLDKAIAAFKARFAIDPRTDLRGITLYGTGADEDTTGVIAGNENIKTFFDSLPREGMSDYKLEDSGGMHSWITEGKRCYAAVRAHPGTKSQLAIFSSNKARLEKSLAVIDGSVPTLATAEPSVLTEKARDGAILFAAAKDMEQSVSKKAKSNVIQRTREMRVEMGERATADGADTAEGKREMYVEGVLTSASAESALKMKNLSMGALAVAQSALASMPETASLAPLMNGFSMETSGSRLIVNYRRGTDRIMEALKQVAAKIEVTEKGINAGVEIKDKKSDDSDAPAKDAPAKERKDPKDGGG